MSKAKQETRSLEDLFKSPSKKALESTKAKIDQYLEAKDYKVLLHHDRNRTPTAYLMPLNAKKLKEDLSPMSSFDSTFFGQRVTKEQAENAMDETGEDAYASSYFNCQAHGLARDEGEQEFLSTVVDINFEVLETAAQVTITEDGIEAIIPGVNGGNAIEVRRGAASFCVPDQENAGSGMTRRARDKARKAKEAQESKETQESLD